MTKKARHSIETRSTLRKVYEDGESQTIIRQQPVVNVHLVCKDLQETSEKPKDGLTPR